MKASEAGQGGAEIDSVYDFLYHDSRRVGSFLAQFDDSGLLTGLTQREGVTKGAKRGYKFGVGANLPIVGGGNFDIERGPGETGSESAERAYDPFWANAREFLDAASSRGMISRDITATGIGRLVLITGRLVIFDMETLQPAWALPSIRAKAMEGEQQPVAPLHKQKGQAGQRRKPVSDTEIALELLPHMQHSGQIRVLGDGFTAWSSVKREYLSSSLGDLVLHHGACLSGSWSIVGLLDAVPDEHTPELSLEDQINLGVFGDNGITQIAYSLQPLTRTLLGRPNNAYGVTPLLIFREIAV